MNKVIPLNNIHANVRDSFNSFETSPHIHRSAYVHPLAVVTGNVHLGQRVMVAPAASVRGDGGQPIWVADDVNVQDGVVLHALESYLCGELVEEALVEVDGKFYGVHIGERVSLTQQCQIQGPVSIGCDTFIAMQALVFRATVGKNCVVEPKALVMGVNVADGRYVPAGALITTQAAADSLPIIGEDYPLKGLNQTVIRANTKLARSYQEQERRPDLRVA